MQKLCLYFLDDPTRNRPLQERKRILDADLQPDHGDTYGWVVGRAVDVDISILNVMVSKHHARISAIIDPDATVKANAPQWTWWIEDTLSSNRTFVDGYACAPGVPYQLTEGCTIQFGTEQAKVRCSFDLDDTDRVLREAIEDGTIAPHEIEPEPGPSTSWQSDLIRTIRDTPSTRLLLYGLFALAGLALYLLLTGAL